MDQLAKAFRENGGICCNAAGQYGRPAICILRLVGAYDTLALEIPVAGKTWLIMTTPYEAWPCEQSPFTGTYHAFEYLVRTSAWQRNRSFG